MCSAQARPGGGTPPDPGTAIAPTAGSITREIERIERRLLFLATASWIWIGRQGGPWQGWPYLGNYLTRGGGLPQVVLGAVGPPWAWNALTFLVPVLGATLLALGLDAVKLPRDGLRAFAPTLVFAIAVAQFLPSFAQIEFYDRYLLVLLPGTVVLCASWAGTRRLGRSALVVLFLFVVTSIEYTRAYIDRSQAAAWNPSAPAA